MRKRSIKITTILITSLTLISILGIGCVGEINAQAKEDTESEYLPIVERFAERFDLDPDEIVEFLDELKEEKIAEKEEKFEERLDELVEEEKITDEQKQAILDKKEELKTFKEGIEDMTIAEAREAIKAMHGELKDWAEENDLELKDFFPKDKAYPFKNKGFKSKRIWFKN